MAYTTIDDGSAYFQNVLYTGNASDGHAITFDGNSDLQPDLVWIKPRSFAGWHVVTDTSRGLTKNIYPEFHKNIPFPKNNKLIKIGFVSSFFCDHVISKLFKNWIIKLNKNKFETFVYHVGMKNDQITDLIRKKSSFFFNNTDLEVVSKKIISDQLNILVFLDIGMIPKLQILGSLRLAPYQCCAYGVPVTTGLDNIDYFLSAKSMEDDSSQSHYSEKLVCDDDRHNLLKYFYMFGIFFLFLHQN